MAVQWFEARGAPWCGYQGYLLGVHPRGAALTPSRISRPSPQLTLVLGVHGGVGLAAEVLGEVV